MARIENTFKKYLVSLMGTRWHVQSHEDSYSDGIPDLSYGMGGVSGWIELKQIPAWPKLCKTLLKPSRFTPDQVNWLRGRGKKAGYCFVFIKVGAHDYFLFSWHHARNIRAGLTREEYHSLCLVHFHGSVDADGLVDALSARREMLNDVTVDGGKHSTDDAPLGQP